jgi:F420-dependent oxidoreductase-like protein
VRIGLTGGAGTTAKIVEQAQRAEADGFTSLWYASTVGGDPLVSMALAGRQTTRIELGTAVLQTYPCHPLLQANRAASVVSGMGRPGFTLGIGPSHESVVQGVYGLSYEHPGSSTEQYLQILTQLLHGRDVDVEGSEWSTHSAGYALRPEHPVPVLLAALGPRLLRIAGETADGTVLWMAPPRAIETHVTPRLHAAAASAGRPRPRIVAGIPVAVHDNVEEARATAAANAAVSYGAMPNYTRILAVGGASGPGDAAVVGNEESVRKQLQGFLDAGATEIWAAVFGVGETREARAASARRTTAWLRELVEPQPT